MRKVILIGFFVITAMSLCGCGKKENQNVWDNRTVETDQESATNRFQHYTYTIPANFRYVKEESSVNNTYAYFSHDGVCEKRISFFEQESEETAETMYQLYEQSIIDTFGNEYEKSTYQSAPTSKEEGREWTIYAFKKYKGNYADLNGYICVWSDGQDTLYVECFGISPESDVSEASLDDSTESSTVDLISLNEMTPSDWAEYDTTEETTEAENKVTVLHATSMEEMYDITTYFLNSVRHKH